MGKIVVKKIQSQASNTAFQLPSTDGTTGQVLQTDGSANLSWTDKSAKIGSAGIDYTMPATDGNAGQVLQTDGTTGNLEFVTASTNPLSTPDGVHQGLRLCDKYFAGLNTAANVSSITLTVPSSYTTDPSDILSLELVISGQTITNNGSNMHWLLYPMGQDGTTASRDSANNGDTFNQGYGNYYANFNRSSNTSADGTTGNQHFVELGDSYNPYSASTRWDGSQGSSYNYKPNAQQKFIWWNSATYPQLYIDGSIGRTGESGTSNPQQRTYVKAANPSNTSGFHKTSPSNLTHSMGFKLEYNNGATMRDGVYMLFARFKDGVVS